MSAQQLSDSEDPGYDDLAVDEDAGDLQDEEDDRYDDDPYGYPDDDEGEVEVEGEPGDR